MKVTVTMEFESMEAAAAYLFPKDCPAPAEAPKPTKKRAGNKATEAVAVAQTAVEAVAKEATTVAETATQAVKHTLEHVQAALEAVFEKHGLATARGLLSRFGVQRAKDLKPEQYTAFVTDAGKVAETGTV